MRYKKITKTNIKFVSVDDVSFQNAIINTAKRLSESDYECELIESGGTTALSVYLNGESVKNPQLRDIIVKEVFNIFQEELDRI